PARTLFHVLVQLKATSQILTEVKRRLSFRIEKDLYNQMRVDTVDMQWLLVLLVLPGDRAQWLRCSPQALTMKRCAYWVSLRNAPPPPTGPDDRLTIHVPRRNRFTMD